MLLKPPSQKAALAHVLIKEKAALCAYFMSSCEQVAKTL